MIEFTPFIEKRGSVNPIRDETTIKRESMLFSCDVEHAFLLGGPLTHEVLRIVSGMLSEPKAGRNWIIDTRVHMLKKGFYPAIPGWHCDAISRGKNGQPAFPTEDGDQRHFTVMMASVPGLCETEFLTEPYSPSHSVMQWTQVWQSVDESVTREGLRGSRIPLGEVWTFNSLTLHRATPAHRAGWRFFFRASEMKSAPRNEIRTQTQVYCDLRAGW